MGKFKEIVSRRYLWGVDFLMIFVTLGTQDKGFVRLLQAIDREILKGNIREKVIVQAGYTKYTSKNMEILDLISPDEFDDLMDKSDLVITHGGAGSILSAIKKDKTVIAAARLKKYKEHTNDHQRQLIREFSDKGYILELRDFNKLDKLLEKAKVFKPRKFLSNTDNMIALISDYIEKDNHVSWYNKCREVLLYLLFGGMTTVINIFSFISLRYFNISIYISNVIAWVVSVLFAFITNKLFVFESRNKTFKDDIRESFYFFGFRILSLFFDMAFMFLLVQILSVQELFSKVLANILVILLNYVFSKIFVFRK